MVKENKMNEVHLMQALMSKSTGHKERLQNVLLEIEKRLGSPSLREINKVTGCNYTAWLNWRAGIAFPTLKSLRLIAKARGCTLERLLSYLEGEIDELSEIDEELDVDPLVVKEYLESRSSDELMELVGKDRIQQIVLEAMKEYKV